MSGSMELTLVMVKPDAMQRRLLGTILRRLEQKGLVMVAGDLRQLSRETAARHYSAHQGKYFYDRLMKFICSGPVFVSVWRGPQAIQRVRTLVGATSPEKAQPGTIRGDFALHITQNLVHASDSPASASREIAIFFPDNAFFDITAVDADLLSPPD